MCYLFNVHLVSLKNKNNAMSMYKHQDRTTGS